MTINCVPEWMQNLDFEDISFIKRFLLASGSLKEMAKEYGVTYPTVRTRLNRLINKIKIVDFPNEDNYIKFLKKMALEGKIDIETTKILIEEYKRNQKEIENYDNLI